MKKKSAALVTAGVITVAAAGGAYAYWTATGSGSGTASTSTGASNLTVGQTSTISNMFPGDAPQTISGTVTNNAANSAYVAQVVVSISSVTKAVGAPAGTCDDTDYTLSNPTMLIGTDIATGATVNFTGASLHFNNKATVNQDACKGATVNLSYSAS
jgi:hypothetical protein